MKQFTVKEDVSLKEFTDNTYPQGSFYFRQLLKNRDIRVNGVKVGGDCPLKKGDIVAYYLKKEQEGKPFYAVVYEDNNILIADKESGVNSEALFSALREEGEYYFIHRLDRNTSGLIVFAKNREAESELLSLFKTHAVEKKYLALCFGKFKADCGILEAYLKKDADSSTVKISMKNIGEKIVTEYRVLKREGEVSLVEVTLHTGKTHQIRAHLAFVGCPVAGDTKYGDKALNEKYKLKRQCLISHSIKFISSGVLSYLTEKTFLSARKFDILS